MELSDQIQGMTKAFDQYLGDNLDVMKEQKMLPIKNQLQANKSALDTKEASDVAKYKQGLEGTISPEMGQQLFSQVSPEFGDAAMKALTTFKQTNGRDMTTDEAAKTLEPIMKALKTKNEGVQKSDDTRLTQYARSLQADREFTNIRQTRDNIEKVGALLDQVESQPEGADKRQLYENAVSQMRVLAQSGQIAEKEIDHLLPSTYQGNFKGFLEKISNEPEGTETQAFMKRSRDFFHREANTTNNQLSRRVNELSAPYKQILERNPEAASETFKTYNVNHPKYNPKHDEEQTAPRPGARVSVTSPDGQTGSIPVEQLEEALKHGYKQGK